MRWLLLTCKNSSRGCGWRGGSRSYGHCGAVEATALASIIQSTVVDGSQRRDFFPSPHFPLIHRLQLASPSSEPSLSIHRSSCRYIWIHDLLMLVIPSSHGCPRLTPHTLLGAHASRCRCHHFGCSQPRRLASWRLIFVSAAKSSRAARPAHARGSSSTMDDF